MDVDVGDPHPSPTRLRGNLAVGGIEPLPGHAPARATPFIDGGEGSTFTNRSSLTHTA
jgi:hypothetical protein